MSKVSDVLRRILRLFRNKSVKLISFAWHNFRRLAFMLPRVRDMFRRITQWLWNKSATLAVFFKDNFMMLATMILSVWFLAVWIVFINEGFELNTFIAYATFGTSLATLLLAFATVLMARESKASREENRKLVEAPRIRELVMKVINPLLEYAEEIGDSHRKREYSWITPSLEDAKQLIGRGQDVTLFQYNEKNAFLPYPHIQVNKAASELNRALYYGDFSRAHSSLVGRIRQYDEKAEDFRHLLLGLVGEILSPRLRELLVEERSVTEDPNVLQQRVLVMTCLAVNKLLGASQSFAHNQVRNEILRQFLERYEDFVVKELGISVNITNKVQQIIKEADSFVEELKVIQEQLLKIKDGYRKDYHLTYEETEKKKPGPIY